MTEPVSYICRTCGTQYPPSQEPPASCPICEDDRQYVGPRGQEWTSLEAMRGHYHNRFSELEPGVTAIVTEPAFAIGQQAHLIETPHGNVLWDCLTFLDETTLAELQRRGGVAAIAISHAHYYSTMGEWSRALGNVPVYIHADDREWVVNPPETIEYLTGETREIVPGVTLIRCGGHFPGALVLHWREGAEGRGALFSGDTIQVVADRRWVTFMYSYPNSIPLDVGTVRGIAAAVAPFPCERLYGAFGRHVLADASAAVQRSAERYV
ncbi:MAG TPA: MBL fold metallo-hydrolase, partial [Thermomicrobiaceae bacterium]|nr:MBL fold metallo-hydrolase [Thermomicrobiaceae bacterium]